jgi:uncharacterized protein with HEPN domain
MNCCSPTSPKRPIASPAFSPDPNRDQFLGSELLRSAVAQKLVVIGEAAGRVSAEIRNRNPEIPWVQIVAFRNILTHAYCSIDWEIVWRTATQRCPDLRGRIARILEQGS